MGTTAHPPPAGASFNSNPAGDIAAYAPGAIVGSAIGSFPSTTGLTSESGGPGGNCVGANCFSLQLNSQTYPPVSTAYTDFSTNYKASWVQYVYYDNGASTGQLWIWYVLIGYSADNAGSCPTTLLDGYAWQSVGGTCYGHTTPTGVPPVSASSLSSLVMETYADYKGSSNDVLTLCVSGSCSYTTSAPDSVLDLAQYWDLAEFNVFGDGGGSNAAFDAGTTVSVAVALTDESNHALTVDCVYNAYFTGEGSNLYYGPCGTVGSGIAFTEATIGFSLSISPSDATVLRGQTVTFLVTVTLTAGTTEPVSLSVLPGLPPGATDTLTSSSVTPNGTSTLHVSTSLSGGLGDYTVTLQGQFGLLIETATAGLHMYDFTVNFVPTSLTLLRGTSGTYDFTFQLLPGSSTTNIPEIAPVVSGLPGDAGYTLNTHLGSGFLVPNLAGCTPSTQSDCASLVVATHGPPSGSLGDFTFHITATDPDPSGGSRSGSAQLHIFDFSVILTPISRTTLRGTTTVYDLTLKLLPGSSTVGIPAMTMSVTGAPVDTTYTFSATSITPTVPGCSTATLQDCQTVTAVTAGPPSGSLGNYTFTVTATDPVGGSRSTVPPGQLHIFDFTVGLAPPTETIVQGGSVTMSVTLTLVPGSTNIGLPGIATALVGLPSDVVAVGFPSTMTIGEKATFKLESSSVASYVSCPEVVNGGGQILPGANLAHCNLAGYDLDGDILYDANLVGANLAGATLEDANLANADLASANLMGTDFQGANLEGADLSAAGAVGLFGITVVGSVDGGSRTSNPSLLTVLGDELSGDDFAGANLAQANLTWTMLTGYVYDFTNFNEADLAGANLTAAVCGSPNDITAAGVDTQGIVNVPPGCNPPLGFALEGVALTSPLSVRAAWESIVLLLTVLGLVVVIGAMSRRRPPRPRSSVHQEESSSRTIPPRGGGPSRRTNVAPVPVTVTTSLPPARHPDEVLRRARRAQAVLVARGDLRSAWMLGQTTEMLAKLSKTPQGRRQR